MRLSPYWIVSYEILWRSKALLKREMTLLILVTVALTPRLAAAAPTSDEIKQLITEYGSEQGSTYQDKKSEVESNIESWQNPDRGDWGFGNPAPDLLFDIETDWLEEFQTLSCNFADIPYSYYHSYDDLHSEPEIETKNCEIHFKYEPDGSGRKSGECVLILSIPPYCWVFIIRADLVEYAFPTHKISLSEQIYQSRYLDMFDTFPALMELAEHLQVEAPLDNIPETINMVKSAIGDTSAPIVNLPTIPPLFFNPTFWTWLQGLGGQKGFSRHWGEPDFIEDDEWWIPHIHADEPEYITDFEDYKLSYWLPESASVNSSHLNKHLSEPQECVRNNFDTEKSDIPELETLPNWS